MRKVDADKILSTVKETLGGREQNYSDCRPMFDKIGAMWSAYLGFEITRKDAAYMMELFKIARIKSGKWQPDNGIDNIGYATLAYVVEALGDDGMDELIDKNVSVAEIINDDPRLEAIRNKTFWDQDRFDGPFAAYKVYQKHAWDSGSDAMSFAEWYTQNNPLGDE